MNWENKEQRAAYKKLWQKNNPEKVREANQRWQKNNIEKVRERQIQYGRSKHGKIIRTLNRINQRCYNPNCEKFPRYGGRGIQNYLTYENISMLWNRDEGFKLKKPSIDRKDNNGDYTIENCRFIEMDENSVKDKFKAIKQLTVEGILIKVWKSATDIIETMGGHASAISMCCTGKRKTYKGFKWGFVTGDRL